MTTPKKAPKKKPAAKLPEVDLEAQAAEMAILPGRPSEKVMNDANAVLAKKDPKSDAEAKALMDLSQSDGWLVFKEYLIKRGQRLLQLTREANRSRGYNFTDAGFGFTLYDQLAAADEAAIAYVEGPAKMKAFDHDTPDDADRANNEQ